MLPTLCPSCHNLLDVQSLRCGKCHTEVAGSYRLPLLARLSDKDQAFVLSFVRNSGSLKEMACLLGLSYPTVRNMLDEIIEKLKNE